MTGEVAYLALGSNLGERRTHLETALERIAELDSVVLLAQTGVEETAPVGEINQGPFLNQMIAVRTSLTPRLLLEACQGVETAGGRVRDSRWGPRTIDVDIVRFGDLEVAEDDLVIPHPEIQARDFWGREIVELDGLLQAAPRGK